uniref:(northern house mosquito) hypothetical protein n=1 Tax=Culex pipiens TaxID=7175 RepID=A0A8D8KFZ4_CULPI
MEHVSKLRMNLEKQESLVKLGILTTAAILCECFFALFCRLLFVDCFGGAFPEQGLQRRGTFKELTVLKLISFLKGITRKWCLCEFEIKNRIVFVQFFFRKLPVFSKTNFPVLMKGRFLKELNQM